MTVSPSERSIRFRAGDVELGGRVCIPEGASRACVVCHPHPLYGGDSHSSVVVAVVRALASTGIATLRFDFRGAGTSGGVHGGGVPEVEDARAAVATLAAAAGLPGAAIAGYSFGSIVAMRLAAEPRSSGIEAVAAIAPPLAMFEAAFAEAIRAPLLLLGGDRDAYCPGSDLESLASRCGARVEVLRSADHFLAGREDEVAAVVASWLCGLRPRGTLRT